MLSPGLIPSTEAIAEITEQHTALRPVDMFSLRAHYAETLRLWRGGGFRSWYLNRYQWTSVREAQT